MCRENALKIAVVGAGGVGGYFGGRLAAAGCDVTFIARGAHLQALRGQGLRIHSANGDAHVKVNATDDPAAAGVADCIWIAVKLWDTEQAALAARRMIGPHTTVVSFQNGVEKEDVLRGALPGAHLMGGACYIAAVIAEPGVVEHTGTMARLEFGEFDGRHSACADALLDACRRAGVDAEIPDDIRVAVWRKFVLLVGLSATTCAVRAPIGVVRAHPLSRQLLVDVVGEAVAVGRAAGVTLNDELVASRMAQLDSLPAAMTSSMHQDLKRGNRLEVAWLSGAVVRLGERYGVPTPYNRAVWAALEPYAAGAPL